MSAPHQQSGSQRIESIVTMRASRGRAADTATGPVSGLPCRGSDAEDRTGNWPADRAGLPLGDRAYTALMTPRGARYAPTSRRWGSP